VELNPIPIDDTKSKDITVNWKLFSDFKVGKKFWTDSCGLEMEERIIESKDNRVDNTIAANYYPVTSAIAVRDQSSDKQVTILNDRSQGGAADLSDDNTIELM